MCIKFVFYNILFDGLVQDCSNSIANALELLQSCTKLSSRRFEINFQGRQEYAHD